MLKRFIDFVCLNAWHPNDFFNLWQNNPPPQIIKQNDKNKETNWRRRKKKEKKKVRPPAPTPEKQPRTTNWFIFA